MFECEKSYKKNFNKDFIKRFENKYQFCDKCINRFISILRKRVYPYEYMIAGKDLIKSYYL